MYSQSEENYLKAICHLQLEGAKAVPTNMLSEHLRTRAASVTEMVKKLAQKKLVNYKPYYGVTLTKKGREQALWIIRKHRLWETFLVERLGFNWDEVHEVAEQLEHIKSEKLIDAIDRLLNHPAVDPHGDPIPDKQGNIETRNVQLLADCQAGTQGTFVGVRDDSATFLQYLDSHKITLGKRFKVRQREAFDDSMEIEVDGTASRISKKMSANLYVRPD